jgi:hypothetical protein
MPMPVSFTRSFNSPPGMTCAETATWPPGSVNLMAFDMRFSMICRMERRSATTLGSSAGNDFRSTTRAAVACSCSIFSA